MVEVVGSFLPFMPEGYSDRNSIPEMGSSISQERRDSDESDDCIDGSDDFQIMRVER